MPSPCLRIARFGVGRRDERVTTLLEEVEPFFLAKGLVEVDVAAFILC